MFQLSDIVTQAEHSQPDSFVIVTGDFNKANPKKERVKFIQQVTCATRDGRTLDHSHTTIKGAYRSIPRAPFGRSDHAMVYLVPTYKQQLTCVKPTMKMVKQWTVNAVETLRGCYECTDWGVLKKAATDIHEYTETVSDYITFCEGLCIPTKTIASYPTTNRGSICISNTSYMLNTMSTKTMTKTNTRKRDMQRKRPSRPARPNTVTSLR